MELEDLKSMWTSVDERLKKQELLKESIIRKMMREKSSKSLDRLRGFEALGAAVSLFVIPLIIYLNYFTRFHMHQSVIYIVVAVCVIVMVWQIVKVGLLQKMDFMKSINSNLLQVNRYNVWIKRERIILLLTIPVILCLPIWLFVNIHAVKALQWVIFVCGTIFGALAGYYLYNFYNRHIDSIRQSLEDLKELEEK
ncbi:MAG: hypothetical protein LBJ57_01555 [Prevotellaceae bacterium]|jgi:uncharacterized protein YacL|nr:hypothetical protein [Prevotellaceae bacterium]